MASAPPNRTTMTPASQVAAEAATSASATRRQRAKGQALAIVLPVRRAAAGDVAIPASPAPKAGVACPAALRATVCRTTALTIAASSGLFLLTGGGFHGSESL